jgi:hypothetical protein
VQVGATFHSDRGGALAANSRRERRHRAVARSQSLQQRPNVTVNLIEPGTVYADRVKALDLRFVKIDF